MNKGYFEQKDQLDIQIEGIYLALAPYRHRKEVQKILKRAKSENRCFYCKWFLFALVPISIGLLALIISLNSLILGKLGSFFISLACFLLFCYLLPRLLLCLFRPGKGIEIIFKNLNHIVNNLKDLEAREAYQEFLEQQEQRQIRSSQFYEDL